ncbi:chemotaxis protein CheB [Sphingomonas sp.]|uniref:chemotaxis protein CheB n=1 Tax=Sphingomonas sp. TaxID=28214 RepID=UPI003B3A7B76
MAEPRSAGPQAASAPRTTGPIRVLIVDDSIVARAALSRLLDEDDDIVVAGSAGSAPAALRLLAELRVDVILLDLEMPGVGGLAALPELLAAGQGARVLIVSSACADGAAASIAALRAGAADTLLKPMSAGFSGPFARDLTDRLRRIAWPDGRDGAAPADPRGGGGAPARQIECLGIGASTGGVHALATFFAALPREFAAPILVTQHLPAPFMPYFATQLTDMAGRRTRIAAAGLQLIAGEILLAPGDAHLTLARTGGIVHVRLERKRAASGCLPSVDPMFASMAKVYGPAAVGVVLSGMGRDGVDGAALLVGGGGAVFAQDRASSVVWGMPGAVANAGLARVIAPAGELARRLAEREEGAARWR